MKHYKNVFEKVNVVQCQECGLAYNIRSMVPGSLKGTLQVPDYCPHCGEPSLEEIVGRDEDLSDDEYEE